MDRLGSTDCECIRESGWAQPVNTATSLAFLPAAATVAVRGGSGGHRAESLAFAGLLALVGAGSVAFHGPQPRGAKAMHDWPIAGLLGVATVTPLVRRVRGRRALPGWSTGRGAALGATAGAAVLAYAGGRTSAPTCRPNSVIQLHGAWHMLAAAAFVIGAEILYAPETTSS